jgi:hypothetical protein
MQQFKLVAGLQTMYTMLLAANSWPGSQLTEYKGNPLVHDILDRLGLLEYEKDQELDLDMEDHDSDHQSNSDEASTTESPHGSQRETGESPKSALYTPLPHRRVQIISSIFLQSLTNSVSASTPGISSRHNLNIVPSCLCKPNYQQNFCRSHTQE